MLVLYPEVTKDFKQNRAYMRGKTGVLLVNLGTPDSTKVSDVRKYLRQFLSDGRVIDISPLGRFLLVNFIIAPFRSPKSAKEYRKVWTEKGSPLLYHSVELTDLLRQELDESTYQVELGMRYQNPSIKSALDKLQSPNLEKLIVIPLFPQYASATTGSVHQEVMEIISKWQLIPKMVMIDSFADNELMVNTFAEMGKKYMDQDHYDHFLFSYHGLPERQLKKADPDCHCDTKCCSVFTDRNRLCYRAQCYETSRLLAKALGITEKQYSVSFQSRLGKTPWIQPYTEDVVHQLAEKGVKKLLTFSPSFVADCLETTVEINEEYGEQFVEHGGEKLQLVESLNTHPMWVQTLKEMVLAN